MPTGLDDRFIKYNNAIYPAYEANGNAVEHIENTANHWCKGIGLDIGAIDKWCIKGAIPINIEYKNFMGMDAYNLPDYEFDYIFSSHCLEHLLEPIPTLQYWIKHIKSKGVLFLYLPHPDQEYWRPANCKKHRNVWYPKEIYKIFKKLSFDPIVCSSGHDLYHSFSIVGIKK